jgi:hypothetical protein
MAEKDVQAVSVPVDPLVVQTQGLGRYSLMDVV